MRAAKQNLIFDKYPQQQQQLIYVLERMLEGRNERLEFYQEQNRRFDDELSPLLEVED
jgi:hypothetical protein